MSCESDLMTISIRDFVLKERITVFEKVNKQEILGTLFDRYFAIEGYSRVDVAFKYQGFFINYYATPNKLHMEQKAEINLFSFALHPDVMSMYGFVDKKGRKTFGEPSDSGSESESTNSESSESSKMSSDSESSGVSVTVTRTRPRRREAFEKSRYGGGHIPSTSGVNKQNSKKK